MLSASLNKTFLRVFCSSTGGLTGGGETMC